MQRSQPNLTDNYLKILNLVLVIRPTSQIRKTFMLLRNLIAHLRRKKQYRN